MKKIVAVIIASVMVMLSAAGCGGQKAESTIEPWKPDDKNAEGAINMATTDGWYSLNKVTFEDKLKTLKFGCEYYEKDKLIKDYELTSSSVDDEKTGLIGMFYNNGILATRYTAGENESTVGGLGDLDGLNKKKDSVKAFSPMEDKKTIKPGKKIYIAALADGDYIADPDGMIKNDSTMKKNKKNWVIYVIFEKKKDKK